MTFLLIPQRHQRCLLIFIRLTFSQVFFSPVSLEFIEPENCVQSGVRLNKLLFGFELLYVL